MFRFLVRLDDACPTMSKANWDRIEEILDQYSIKPIVGVIPDCKDRHPVQNHPIDEDFWNKVRTWESKEWEIAVHGLHHTYHAIPRNVSTFQLNIEPISEFAGISHEEQNVMIRAGINILKEQGICPTCFFAPAHTFDLNTVKACIKADEIKFISDGYALRPYKKAGMTFIPAVFDTPHKMPFGLFTFVFHPSSMSSGDFKRLACFLERNHQYAITVDSVLKEPIRRQGIFGHLIELLMYTTRVVKKCMKR